MDDLATLREWVKCGEGKRTVEIKIGQDSDTSYLNIWAYDYELQDGQFVKSASEIDISKKKQEDERELYQKLKLKYEGIL